MMVRQRFENEYKPLFETRRMGTTIWSPLLMGLLCGRYNDGNIPDGRVKESMKSMSSKFQKYFNEEGIKETKRLLQGLEDIAKDVGYTQAQLALAWTIANEDTSVALLGFSRIEQVDENLKAVELLEKWTKELEERVTTHLDTTPEMDIGGNWQPMKPRRPFNY